MFEQVFCTRPSSLFIKIRKLSYGEPGLLMVKPLLKYISPEVKCLAPSRNQTRFFFCLYFHLEPPSATQMTQQLILLESSSVALSKLSISNIGTQKFHSWVFVQQKYPCMSKKRIYSCANFKMFPK